MNSEILKLNISVFIQQNIVNYYFFLRQIKTDLTCFNKSRRQKLLYLDQYHDFIQDFRLQFKNLFVYVFGIKNKQTYCTCLQFPTSTFYLISHVDHIISFKDFFFLPCLIYIYDSYYVLIMVISALQIKKKTVCSRERIRNS